MEKNCRGVVLIEQRGNMMIYHRCLNDWTHVFKRDEKIVLWTCEEHKDIQKYWTIVDGVVSLKHG